MNYINIIDDKGIFYQFTPGESYQQDNARITSSWILRNIISADKADTVSFVYTGFYREHFTISQYNVLKDKSSFLGANVPPDSDVPSGGYDFDEYESPHMPNNGYNMYRLTEIRFRQGRVKFNLHTDIPVGSPLSDDMVKNIQILNRKGEVLKTIEFSQTKLNSFLDGIKPVNKLDLIQFKDKSGRSIEKYAFEHYPVASVSGTGIIDVRHCDWWGYYNASGVQRMVPSYTVDLVGLNGRTSYQQFGAPSNREPRLEAARSGVLKKITYPTGGSAEFTYGINKYRDDFNQVKGAGGLRIEQIKTNDANGNAYYKTYKYENGFDGGDNGFIELIPSINTMASESKYVYLGFGGMEPMHPGGTFRERTFYSGFLPSLSVLAESPIVYPRVTEYHGTLTDNTGKTVYTYDYSHQRPQPLTYTSGLTIPRFHVYSHNFWNYNTLVDKEEYERVVNQEKTTYTIRKRTHNAYDEVKTEEIKGFHVQRTHVFPQNGSIRTFNHYPDWYAALDAEERTSIYGYRSYIIPVGVKNLLWTTETIYSDNNEPFQNSVSYTYNSRQLVSEIKRTSSKGDNLFTRKTYPFELTSPLYQKMTNEFNMLDYVIEQNEFKGTTPLESVRTDYKDWSNNIVAPEIVSTRQGGNDFEPRLRYKAYDRGRILGVSKEDDINIAYLWGYNQSYLIAEVKNAQNTLTSHNSSVTLSKTIICTPGDFQQQYITFTTTDKGTINLDTYFGGNPGSSEAAANFDYTLSGPTKRSGSLTLCASPPCVGYPSAITLTDMPAGNYTLTITIKSNTATSNVYIQCSYPGTQVGTSGIIEFYYEGFEDDSNASIVRAHTGRKCNYARSFIVNFTKPNSRTYMITWHQFENNKWVYKQENYTGSKSFSGSLYIDDIRILPADAQMTTYTYDPLIGMTSDADANGRTTYYEYNSFGRLFLVKDDKGNIIKSYKYNYKQ